MLRKARNGDEKQIQTVLHAAFKQQENLRFPFSAASVGIQTITSWIDDSELYLIEEDGEVCGVFRLSKYEKYGLVLSRLAVNPTHKGRGIGRLLLNHAEQIAMKQNEESLTLKTPQEHPFLVNYYTSHGYTAIGTSFREGDKYVEVVLRKQLD